MLRQTLAFSCFLILQINAATLKNGDHILDLQSTSNGTALSLSFRGQVKIVGAIGSISEANLEKCDQKSNCRLQEDEFTLDISNIDGGWKLVWESQNLQQIFSDCINLGGLNWYAGPEKIQADWPVEKLIIEDSPYVSSKIDNTAVAERYWLHSQGGYVYVDERVPLFVDQNNLNSHQLCLKAAVQGPYVGRKRVVLSYALVALDDPKQAHLHAVNNYLGKPKGHPNEKLIRKPIWTTWAKYKAKINDSIVLDFAKDVINHGFSGQLEIDDKWEDCYGSTVFDTVTFADVDKTVATLKQLGFTVTIWTHPFVNADCELAKVGLEKDYFVKNANGQAKSLWWNGLGYSIDFTKKEARDWYVNRLKTIQERHGVDSFKFDAGETDWSPQVPILSTDIELAPNQLTSDYVRTVAGFGDLVEVRSAWKTQDLPIFLRMIDKDSRWDDRNGLYTLITTLLQLNLNGYTLVLPDMVGGNGYQGDPSAELLARWTQANTFMPSMQFSYLPWDITSDKFDGVKIIKKYVDLHEEYADVILEAIRNSIEKGTPVNPPIWWVDPTNPEALKCDDEYLLGEKILVAPVIEENATSRNIILPKGKWKDGNDGKIYVGPIVLQDYPAPIDVLPYFGKCDDC